MKQKNTSAKVIAAIVFVLFCVAAPFLAVFLTGVCLPAQFTLTWYGAFPALYENICDAEGDKIVVVGNSNVAFGVDSALMEELLRAGGLDYTVCNFGLYGSLGTKMMLDLAIDRVEEGDIVVLVPELAAQSLSTYFSAAEAWYAIDGDLSLFGAFGAEERGALAGSFFAYTAQKLEYCRSGAPAQPSGVYASASFDERGDLKNCDRPYNVMQGGYDANNTLALDASLFSDAFVSYVNDCAAQLAERGASLWFSFPPMNAAAFAEEPDADAFQTAVTQLLGCPVISAAEDYIMEAGWFYDSNFHLNEAGMTVRTVQLVNDVKNQLGNATKTETELPNMPVAPDEGVEGEGNNEDSDCFTYELENGYYTVTGLTEQGRAKTSLTLPYQVNGIYIHSFTAQVFAGDTAVQSITIQDNIRSLPDGCFSGCTALRSVYLTHTDPADIAVGYGLFEGTAGTCTVYVPQEALTQFANNYFWGRYADRLGSY